MIACRCKRFSITPVLMGFVCLLFSAAVFAEDVSEGLFSVASVETTLEDDVYRVSAQFDLQFSDKLREALDSGIPLTFAVELDVLRERAYVWDPVEAHVSQRYEIRYNLLTENYELKNLNSGLEFSLPRFDIVKIVLSNFSNFPLIDSALLQEENTYIGRIKVSVDVESLPVPLRLMAYVTSGWSLESEWYTWQLQP